ncbi:hypothetical protein [Marinobacter sp.]|uniref:hypothetical protein n=1 Tax=Marinobacter sp. TaxID=50741 RepID=UPI000C453B82|nr:hypothetical protein [Marinobacter sp.]MBE97361.1 hypothetical protein [Marinobacter sp.]
MKTIQKRISQGFLGALIAANGVPAALAVEVPTASGIKLDILTQGKFQPTYFSNFDLDSSVEDGATGTSAGAVQVGDEHVRAEVRLGVVATGDNWTGKILLENDFALDANSVDRAFRGERFGLEQAYFTYTFDPAFTLQGGWTFKNLDLASGGLLYGDDHPLFGAMGKTSWGSYDVYWMPITDGLISNIQAPGANPANGELDWDVFASKFDFDLGKGSRISPILTYSDNQQQGAKATYYGVEYIGNIGAVKVRAEALGVTGSFDNGDDISAYAGYAGLEYPVSESFNPFIALRITSGDDDPTDNDVEGWLGITDIGRYSPLIGIDGQFLGWQPNSNQAIASGLFGLALDQAGPGGAGYGGISNAGTGNNPGQIMLSVGSSGNLASISPKLSYQAQVFPMWFQQTGGLETLSTASGSVDSYAGTELDVSVKYQANQYFAPRLVLSSFLPGKGVEDATGADDAAYVAMLELNWNY